MTVPLPHTGPEWHKHRFISSRCGFLMRFSRFSTHSQVPRHESWASPRMFLLETKRWCEDCSVWLWTTPLLHGCVCKTFFSDCSCIRFFKYAFFLQAVSDKPQPRHHKCSRSLLALNNLWNLQSVRPLCSNWTSVGFKLAVESESSIVKLLLISNV